MSNRFFARAAVAGLLVLVGISLGCDKSPSAPTPAAGPAPAAPTVTPPAGPSEVISLTPTPSVVTSGGQLTLNWVGPSGRGCSGGGDWIAIYKVGDPDITGAANGHSDLWFEHVCGATSGTSTLSAPSQPGEYEFRFMFGDTAVARSSPVTVNASASPLVPGPTLSLDGGIASSRQIGQTFWFTGSGYTAGQKVTRYVDPAVNGSTVLTPTLTADGSGNLTWTFTPRCGNPKNTFAIYAIDDATGRTSDTVTQTVTGSASCP
jgi:hypothetical protein